MRALLVYIKKFSLYGICTWDHSVSKSSVNIIWKLATCHLRKLLKLTPVMKLEVGEVAEAAPPYK